MTDLATSRRDLLRVAALLPAGALLLGASDADTASAQVTPPSANLAGFLRLDGVPGGSADDRHRDEVELLGLDFGVTVAGAFSGGGRGGATPSDYAPITVAAVSGVASPRIYEAAARGRRIGSGLITLERRGETTTRHLTLDLRDVVVAAITTSWSSDGAPLDTFALQYGRCTYSQYAVDPAGIEQPPVTSVLDRTRRG